MTASWHVVAKLLLVECLEWTIEKHFIYMWQFEYDYFNFTVEDINYYYYHIIYCNINNDSLRFFYYYYY